MADRTSRRSDLADFGSQPHRPAKGDLGEEFAVAWLRDRGYRILHRNVRTPAGEIDLIARDGEILVFVEIKARGTGQYGRAVEGVTRAKQRRLARCAAWWLASGNAPEGLCRFDVVGLDRQEDGWSVELVRDAFDG